MSTTVTFTDRLDSLKDCNPLKWYLHEGYLANALKFGSRINFDSFILRVENGGSGSKRGGSWLANSAPYNAPIDLKTLSVDNDIHLHYILYGNKAVPASLAQPSKDVLNQSGRWFMIGKFDSEYKPISFSTQVEIIQYVTGDHKGLAQYNVMKQRRQELWRYWATGDERGREFRLLDLPYIAWWFRDVWETPIEYATQDVLSDKTLDGVEKEIIEMLVCSFVIPPTSSNSSIIRRRSKRGVESAVVDDTDDSARPVTRRQKKDRLSDLSQSASGGSPPTTPEQVVEEVVEPVVFDGSSFDLSSLRATLADPDPRSGLKRVGEYEIVLMCALAEEDLSTVNEKIYEFDGFPFSIKEYEKVKSIKRKRLTRYSYNFDILRKEIQENTPSYIPCQLMNDQLLLAWWNEGERRRNGEVLPARLWTSTPTNARVLTMRSALIFRHIVMSFNLPLSSFPALFSAFFLLFLGRPAKKNELPSPRCVRNNIMKCGIIDKHLTAEKFEKTFTGNSLFGFPRYWYTMTDDTKHGKLFQDQRHVVIRAGDLGLNDDGFGFQEPFFDVLSTGCSATKDSKGHSAHNLQVMMENCNSLEALSRYGGNVSDNAAKKEGEDTFTAVMDELLSQGRDELTKVFGVDRYGIVHMDPFHCCNLATQHVTEKGFGKTESGNSRQIHHRQALQSIHDVVIADKEFAQSIADEILLPHSIKYSLKTIRERIQRWLVNGRNAKYILEGFDLNIPGATENFWVLWANAYLPYVDGWKKTALEEIMRNFMMPGIVVALQMEAELVDYFEVTSEWHAYPGATTTVCGLRMMEVVHLLTSFIMPWWEKARTSPELQFPKTFARIDAMEDEEKREMKRQQVIFGIQGGYDEICKVYQRIFKAPMIYLAVLDPKIGPSVLRAILAVIANESSEEEALVDINLATTEFDEEDYGIEVDPSLEWGRFQYDNPEDRPELDNIWYEWLMEADDVKTLAHWWRQLGWERSVIFDELKKLSQETEVHPNRPVDSSHRLHDFFLMYPIIFISLQAVFGLLPSSSRLVEHAHGIMRACWDSQIPTEFWNDKMNYKMMKDHLMKEARRKVIRELNAASENANSSKRKVAKPNDRKETVEMIPHQLQDLVSWYPSALIKSLPGRVMDKIRAINKSKTSARAIESAVLEQRKAAAELKKSRKRGGGEDVVEKMREKADKAVTQHDLDWEHNENDDLKALLDKMLTKEYWKKEVMTSMLKADIFRVFPDFESEEGWDVGKTEMMKPTGKVYDFGAHVAKIKQIEEAFRKGKDKDGKPPKNTINDEDLTGMRKYEIYQVFIKHEQSLTRTNLETDRKRKMKKLGAIFGIFGTEVAPNKRFSSDQTYASMMERSTNADEDTNANEDATAAAAAADDQSFNDDYGQPMDADFFGGVDDGDVDLELGAVDDDAEPMDIDDANDDLEMMEEGRVTRRRSTRIRQIRLATQD